MRSLAVCGGAATIIISEVSDVDVGLEFGAGASS